MLTRRMLILMDIVELVLCVILFCMLMVFVNPIFAMIGGAIVGAFIIDDMRDLHEDIMSKWIELR